MQAKHLVALAGLFALWMSQPAAAASQEPDRVSIPAAGKNEPATLDAMLFKPQGQGPFPAVVAMHGCSGLWSSKNSAELSPRHADWGRRLAALGYVVIFPDSFGSRGLGPQCKNGDREVEPYRERVEDANAARRYLQTLAYVKPAAIALLGWSNGGSTVLYTVRPKDRPKPGSPDFRAAVAFYPGCTAPAEKGDWATRVPLLIVMGEADDWTPAKPCKALADANADSVKLILYPGAYHDFDNEAQKLHELHGLAYTANGDGVAHAGLNPAARAAALKDVPDFLAVLKQ
ncbi:MULTISPECIES: dienelactone hydrolase family protein [Mesorhizobium]|uniref:Dienelactone hydrolase n=2 Tax=Mesorhizobium TaxID=68287 RepID=A0A1A5IJM0_RHILI|nr:MULTISPECIES: dienelactone hydrolase family protein [Mesorhizobium]MBE1707620.1 dienelactone hydrolase family protein [Mesorhizobium japonicum]MBE1712744.1 dienelactone hydrolase family protein [Mesorhizobium japonicum]MUT24920.1 prolyl oligopeptidase family serine peptidase [Mesorhizobium japonicum]MUT31463.1 prolyl oligopeptidase family serine peptidase [Mesorhizobium japonicum]OBP78967.1 dienelactone hydrolase [Mesorhizobium loti]